ncbi:MAG: hypothetical protein KME04_15090 [Pleurocapsa minor GSE-CHR-MK-17-07R]|jgi:hypothetical protein|nr:hypothetical protein [Pleurocapsa minor GSE-CHR-MK 17-07R]
MQKHTVLLVGENAWLIRALYLLIAGDPNLQVVGSCTVQEVVQTTARLSPQIIVFLPEISLISSEVTFLDLRRLFPDLYMLLITPVDAIFYETITIGKRVDEFITQSKLNTDLLPRIHMLATHLQDDQS